MAQTSLGNSSLSVKMSHELGTKEFVSKEKSNMHFDNSQNDRDYWIWQIIHDINFLAKEICGDYLERVLKLLSSCSADVLDSIKQSILQGGKSLKDLVPLLINTIIEALVEKSIEVSYNSLILLFELAMEGDKVLIFFHCFKYFLDSDRCGDDLIYLLIEPWNCRL